MASSVPPSVHDIDALAQHLSGRRIVVLTGAGCSTESGIPDYRGPNAKPDRRPMQYGEFISDATARKWYWSRSLLGWPRVAAAEPNPAHTALAELERRGNVIGVITQNVDGLHRRAGSRRVLALHGSLSRVRCTECETVVSRSLVQDRMLEANPGFRSRTASMAPDGDADLDGRLMESFAVPTCDVCDGVLKPDVVFFGENVPRSRVDEAWALYNDGDVLLVVGSSLTVFSGYRFVLRASQEARPVAIVNVGWTRGDEHAAVKVDANVGAVLPELAGRLSA